MRRSTCGKYNNCSSREVHLLSFIISGDFDGICDMFLVNVDHHAESQPFTLLTVWFTSYEEAQQRV